MKYHELALIPELIAETVLNEKYTGQELSAKVRSISDVEKIERRRVCMSDKHKEPKTVFPKEFPA